MIDALSEDIHSLATAAKSLPVRRGGKRPHVSCLYRWTISGFRGVILESIQIGGTRCTSREALARFFDQLSRAAGTAPSAHQRTAKQREREIAQADAELREAGI
jgi:hypothetical protein